MATEKQIRANKRNALKSTGPRTERGKQASRRNELRHGLTAEQLVIAGEDPDRFKTLCIALDEEFSPFGPTEEFLVARLASLMWRLNRVPGFESSLFAWIGHLESQSHDASCITVGTFSFSVDSRALPAASSSGFIPDCASAAGDNGQAMGRILETLLGKQDFLSKIGRYERQLTRGVEATLAELARLRRRRH
jgi:hypothetical protein